MTPASGQAPNLDHPSTVLLFRTPVPPSQGTDPYHDAFGAFCLPSFPLSALDSGAATPVSLLPMSRVNSHSSAAEGKSPALTSTSAATPGTTTTTTATQQQASSAAPRPEELLLHALQHQQQQSQQRESSPGRKYTRRQPSYHASSSDSAQSFVLTTHHLTQYVSDNNAAPDAQCAAEREWCVTSLPVLGTDDANAQQFQDLLADGDWGAVVATSGRAWDVWKNAAIRCQREGKSPKTNFPETPFFLISSRSAATFRSTTLPDVPSLWAPKANKVYGAPPTKGAKKDGAGGNGGGDKAAGEALAEYILGWLERRRTTAAAASTDGSDEAQLPLLAKPILLLQGDKALPALPRALDASKVPYENIVVYATCEDRYLASNLTRQKAVYECLSSGEDVVELDGDGEGEGEDGAHQSHSASVGQREAHEAQTGIVATPDWIVFFSPSGVDYCAPHLAQLGWFPHADSASAPASASNQNQNQNQGRRPSFSTRTRPHYVALGPTTAGHLADKYGLVEGPRASPEDSDPTPPKNPLFDFLTASSPDPQGVRDAVERGERLLLLR